MHEVGYFSTSRRSDKNKRNRKTHKFSRNNADIQREKNYTDEKVKKILFIEKFIRQTQINLLLLLFELQTLKELWVFENLEVSFLLQQ